MTLFCSIRILLFYSIQLNNIPKATLESTIKMALLLNSLKLFLISAWLLFTALGLNLSVSTITNFFSTHVHLTCPRPPYLFLLLNAIILTIAASSRFHRPPSPPQPLPPPYEVTKHPRPLPAQEDPTVLVDVKPVVVNGVAVTEEDRTVATESTWTPPQEMSPPADPTMEEVWKAITEGQARAVVKRSETVKERRRRRNPMVCATGGAATATTSLRKEPQLSKDELNRRVEAFIRKFNEEMRLQNKQQSLNRSFRADDGELWQ